MKRIIIALVALMFFSKAFSQGGNDPSKYTNYKFLYGNRTARIWGDTVVTIPTDTIWSKDGLALKNGVLYTGNHTNWSPVGGAGTFTKTGGGVTNTGDSLYLANTAVTPGAYGSGSLIPVITFNSKGQAVLAGTVTNTPGWGSLTGSLSSQSDLNSALAAKEATANKNANSGYAGLNGSAKVAYTQLDTNHTTGLVAWPGLLAQKYGAGSTLNSKAIGFGNPGNTVAGDANKLMFDSTGRGHTFMDIMAPVLPAFMLYGFGDSITAGLGSTTDADWLTRAAAITGSSFTRLGLSSSTLEKRSPVDPFGATNAIDRQSSIPTYTGSGYLIIAYGTNDVRYNGANYTPGNFATDYTSLIGYAHTTKGWPYDQIILVTTGYMDSARAFLSFGGNPPATYARQASFDSTILAVAALNGCKSVYLTTAKSDGNPASADGVHPNNWGHEDWARDIVKPIDSIPLDTTSAGPRLGVNGKTVLNSLRLRQNIFLGRNAMPLGIGDDGLVGPLANIIAKGKLILGNTADNGDVLHSAFMPGILNAGGGAFSMEYPGGSIPNNVLWGCFYPTLGFGEVRVTGGHPLFIQDDGQYIGIGGTTNPSDGTSILLNRATGVMNGSFGIGDMTGDPHFFTSGTHLEGFMINNIGYILPYTRGSNTPRSLALNYTGGKPVMINTDVDNSTGAVLQVNGKISANADSVGTQTGGCVFRDNATGLWKIGPCGGGNTNSNVGSAFRLAKPGTNDIKTVSGGPWFVWDSATTNQLRGSVDTAAVVARMRQITNDTLNTFRASLETSIVKEITTTNATPVNVDTIAIAPGEMVTVEVQLNGVKDNGHVAVVAKKKRSFLLDDGSTLRNGTLISSEPETYIPSGSGLSTAAFTITNTGDLAIIQFTGEASTTILAKFTYTVTRKGAPL